MNYIIICLLIIVIVLLIILGLILPNNDQTFAFVWDMYKSNFNTSIYANLGNNPLSFMINMEIQ